MRITTFSDYALRLLMFAHAAGEGLVTIEEAAKHYAISRAHLMKVANKLTKAGFLTAVRGRGGGLKLRRPATEIRLGEVIRATEPGFSLAQHFSAGDQRVVTSVCGLPRVFSEAISAFLKTLDKYSLADIALSKLPNRAPAEKSSPKLGDGMTGEAPYRG